MRATILGTRLFQRVHADAQRGPLRGLPQEPSGGQLYTAAYLKTHYRMRLAARQALAARRGGDSAAIRTLKQGLASCAIVSGAAVLARRRHAQQLRILMYHGVLPQVAGPASFGNLFIDEASFTRQMRHVARAFHVISLEEALGCLQARRPFPDRAVLVTFDDGYRNVLTTALPALRALKLPATVFVLPGLIDDAGGLWFDALRVMLADGLRDPLELGHGVVVDPSPASTERAFAGAVERILALDPASRRDVTQRILERAGRERWLERHPAFALAGWEEWQCAAHDGLLAIGSHGVRHDDFTAMTRDECLEDARQSKQLIERRLGRPCRAIAYPYGRWNDAVAEAARAAGYACAVTTEEGLNSVDQDALRLCRTMIGDKGDLSVFRARVSGVWGPMRAARRVLT